MRVPSVDRPHDPDREMREMRDELLHGEHDVRVSVIEPNEPDDPSARNHADGHRAGEDGERRMPFLVTYAAVVGLGIVLYGVIALWLGWVVALGLAVLAVVAAPWVFSAASGPDNHKS